MATSQTLIDKIATLPAERLAEVENFVDFLVQKDRRHAAFERLLAVIPALRAASVEPMSEDEISAEIDASRAERRARGNAGRSDVGHP